MKWQVWKAGILLAVLALLAVACGPAEAPTPAAGPVDLAALPKNPDGYTDISVAQLAGLLEAKNFTLVNVHIPYEGELPQTDLFIAYDEMAENLDMLPDRDAPIVLYCRSGNMSTTAARELVQQGYTQVYELDGGFNAWKAAGNELLMK
jgi:rhodanese-related sulfurtransferase